MPRKCSGGAASTAGAGAVAERLGRDVRRPVRQRRPLADGAERDPAEAALRQLLEDERGVRRERDLEALGELGDPGELVRHGRDHRAAQALDAALEVDEGAVPLEVARAREDEIGPADGEALEHRDRDHVLGLLGERAHGGIRRRLVARDDQQADRLRVLLLLVRAGGPGVGDAARVRGRTAGGTRRSRASRRARAGGRARPAGRRRRRRGRTRSGRRGPRPRRAARASCPASPPPPGRSRRRCGAPGGSRDRRSAPGRRPSRHRPRRRSRRRRSSRAAPGRRRARTRRPRAGRPSARRGPGAAACRARTPARPSPSRRARSRSGPARRAAAPRRGRARRPRRAPPNPRRWTRSSGSTIRSPA